MYPRRFLRVRIHVPNSLRALVAWLLIPTLYAEVPNAIPQQGRVAVNGANFDGAGQFKFLLFTDSDVDHASGNETPIWSNSATTPGAMSEPPTAVSLTVQKGLYSVWLGDASIPNMEALPESVEPGAG